MKNHDHRHKADDLIDSMILFLCEVRVDSGGNKEYSEGDKRNGASRIEILNINHLATPDDNE